MGRWKSLVIEKLEMAIKKNKQQTLFTIKTRYNKKIITISKLHQIKPKLNNLTYTLKNDMGPVPNGTVTVRTSKIHFHFWKQFISQLLMSLDINWNHLFIFIYIGNNWVLSLSKVRLGKISEPMGLTIVVVI